MSWICSYCNHAAVIRKEDKSETTFELNSTVGHFKYTTTGIVCPNPACRKHSVSITFSELQRYKGEFLEMGRRGEISVIPNPDAEPAKAIDYPDYIPAGILQDYREACAISDLSPKASATLARRCLQGMIRDFWQVKPDTLYNEIQAIKHEISSDMWDVIDGVRKVGNIGAHMEKDINLIIDVNPDEATLLINMIEMLLDDWYVARFEKQQRIEKMKQLAVDKTQAKKP